jgi:hypothetical protein
LTGIKRTLERHITVPLAIWLLLALALVVTACGKASTTPQPLGVGETAEVDGWKITVQGLSHLEGDQWHQPATGNIFCAVELSLENSSGRIRYVMAEKQMQLLDAANHRYAADHDAGVMAARLRQWYVPQGEVGVGQVLHGAAAYQIPVDAHGLHWTFRTGLLPWSKTVVFALGDVPAE